MSQVTVEQLAGVVGVPVERLLQQMKDAGLPHKEQEDAVSDQEKKVLLAFLKESHGGVSEEPKKITLRRKSKSTLKVASSQGRSKTVNVEVRKKRTYVKRSAIEEEQAEAERIAAEEAAAAEQARLEEEAKEQEKRDAEAAAQRKAEDEARAQAAREAKAKADAEAKAAKKREADAKKAAEKPETPEEKAAREKAEAARQQMEEERKRLEAEARKKADEEAAKATLEQARKIAQELESRGGEQPAETPVVQEEQNIATKVEEESYSAEERRSARVIRQKKRLKLKNKHTFQAPTAPKVVEVEIPESVVISDLAQRMSIKAAEVVKSLFNMGMPATINQVIDQDTAVLVVEELGHTYKLIKDDAIEDELVAHLDEEVTSNATNRAPIITVMGHVDHGKTSLLDYIRRAKVASGEAGGITQHVAAYQVETEDGGAMTFLDTPGHAAFSAMRARGANCTDIVVLVVAADDGVMPQTEEAISHAKAAGVPIVVAVNKIDKEEADPDRVKNELVQREVIPEDWGGDTQFVEVSAHTGQGIDDLLGALVLQAEMMELTSVADGSARGVVLEARVDRGRGVVADLLIQRGELKQGDMVLAGSFFGRVRAMSNDTGATVEAAGPSVPVQILGLAGAPEAGEEFLVVPDERKAREVAEFREVRIREAKLARRQSSRLENMFSSLGDEEVQLVNIVLKADVRGSLEALIAALEDLGTDQVKVKVIGSGIGAINESDVNLAVTSGAFILGFNVRADASAKRICQEEAIDLRYYSVIYDVIDDVKQAMTGMLAPERREEIIGIAEVREVYRSSKFGAVAGCMVVEGTVSRKQPIRVLRDEVVVFQGELESLRRFKDDVTEVRNGVECGIAVKSYNDVKPGDKIEVFEVKEVARTL